MRLGTNKKTLSSERDLGGVETPDNADLLGMAVVQWTLRELEMARR